MSVVDEVREQIAQRLKELKPVVDEYHQLEAMVRRLAERDGARSSSGQSSTRRRSTRSTNGRRRGRPRGSGTRSAQALALVQAKPGITIPEMAKGDGNYPQLPLPGPSRAWHRRQGQKDRERLGARVLDRRCLAPIAARRPSVTP